MNHPGGRLRSGLPAQARILDVGRHAASEENRTGKIHPPVKACGAQGKKMPDEVVENSEETNGAPDSEETAEEVKDPARRGLKEVVESAFPGAVLEQSAYEDDEDETTFVLGVDSIGRRRRASARSRRCALQAPHRFDGAHYPEAENPFEMLYHLYSIEHNRQASLKGADQGRPGGAHGFGRVEQRGLDGARGVRFVRYRIRGSSGSQADSSARQLGQRIRCGRTIRSRAGESGFTPSRRARKSAIKTMCFLRE